MDAEIVQDHTASSPDGPAGGAVATLPRPAVGRTAGSPGARSAALHARARPVAPPSPASTSTPAPRATVLLLGGFSVVADDAPVRLQPAAQRLLAHVALQPRATARAVTAAALWPDTDEGKAGANLRSALWRLGGQDGMLLDCTDDVLRIPPDVHVDVRGMLLLARALQDGYDGVDAETALTLLDAELLPGWWDEWVVAERERLRLLQVQGLEALVAVLLDRGDHGRALECCLRLVACEPFRESAHRLLLRVHVAQGNLADALHHYKRYRDLLRRELGLRPSPYMEALVRAEVCRGELS